MLLLGLLGAALALFVAAIRRPRAARLPQLRLVLDTAVTLAAGIVAVLAEVRFSVEGRKLDFLLCGGFFVAALSTFAFGIAPSFGGEVVERGEAWAVAPAPRHRADRFGAVHAGPDHAAPARIALVDGRPRRRNSGDLVLRAWTRRLAARDGRGEDRPVGVIVVLALQAFLSLIALIGFGLRFRREGEDLDSWLGLAASLALFAELHYVFTPVVSNEYVSQGDFLRLLSYGVLLAGVWRAIRFAEFGRAVLQKSGPVSLGRSTTGWRSTCSRSRRTRACSTRRPRPKERFSA